jgi:hypothetical protein
MTKTLFALSSVLVVGCASDPKATPVDAKVTVDGQKLMSALTADEQATMCNQLSEALTKSLGTPDTMCYIASSNKDAATCENAYNTCVAQAPAVISVLACTPKNVDMFQCDITVAQFTTCFDAYNSYLLEVTQRPACSTEPAPDDSAVKAACASAPCDYFWID